MSGVKQVTVQAISPVVLEAAAERRRVLARQLEEGRRALAELDRDLEQARLRAESLESEAARATAPLEALEAELGRLRQECRGLERRRAAMQRETVAGRDEARAESDSAGAELRGLEADLHRLRMQQRALQRQRAEILSAADALRTGGLGEAQRRLQELQGRKDEQAASLEAVRVRLEAWLSDPRQGAMVEALTEAAAHAGFRPVRTLQDPEEVRFVFQDAAERTLHVALQAPPPEGELPSWVVTPGRFSTDRECVSTFEDLLRNLAAEGVLATGRRGRADGAGAAPAAPPVPLDQRVRD